MITLDEVRRALNYGVADTGNNDQLSAYILQAVGYMESVTHCPLVRVTDKVYSFRPKQQSQTYPLPYRVPVAMTALTERVIGTETEVELTGYCKRIGTASWQIELPDCFSINRIYTATLDVGFDPDEDTADDVSRYEELRRVCMEIVLTYARRDGLIGEAATLNLLSESLGQAGQSGTRSFKDMEPEWRTRLKPFSLLSP